MTRENDPDQVEDGFVANDPFDLGKKDLAATSCWFASLTWTNRTIFLKPGIRHGFAFNLV